ncbi:hypothetical protein HJC23_001622 [Cyclotella cryptica]|uniref:Heme oxygenase n=1 Tax=Cyclotella cryptica TaxID=29204 RepID=A0ABD3QK45_9STRA|eukprot:CCRYP_004651-RA/>CCRYP_004651-RA protein AED:0.03 eAED:0.03 QI:463/-1/1/1/-1/1/1/292/272
MSDETERTDKIRDQGAPDGLFRACMDAIRTSHTLGQSLRNASLAAGLLTDRYCYAEMLGQFYVVTAALEERMDDFIKRAQEKKVDARLVSRVKKLDYSFRSGYEIDLEALLGSNWKETITSWATEPARRYARRLQSANDVECVAAAFILHGPLIIGGGAALKPRVEKAFGKNATNIFSSVVGPSRGGRAGRRREFIQCYDQLLDGVSENDGREGSLFREIVAAVREFMDLNNEMMMAVQQSPWWHKYVKVTLVVLVSYVLGRVMTRKSFTEE